MSKEVSHVRKTICETANAMVRDGLTQRTFGNVSARIDDDLVAITPSAIDYDELEPSDVPLLDLDGTEMISPHEPSTETPIHLAVYRNRADANSVLHTHSPFATVYACLGEPIRPYHNTLAHAGGEIAVSEYANNGTEKLARYALDALQNRKACLLRNHGVLAIGESLRDAYYVASIVEFCAKMQYFATQVGEPERVSDRNLQELSDHYRSQLNES